ncbi:unnamed protein product [Peniophora sp. CBMAI 1063]|nr:unnamed protein product [Peniophora sp. CBMAI 1063]
MSSKYVAVLTVESSTTINAPRPVVRDALLGFASYPEWTKNFVTNVELLDAEHNLLPDQRAVPSTGSWVRVTATLPDSTSTHINDELLIDYDANVGTLAWHYEGFFGMLKSERFQTLEEAEDGTTVYKTRSDFWGPAAWPLKWTSAVGLQAGFDAFGKELKARAEALK